MQTAEGTTTTTLAARLLAEGFVGLAHVARTVAAYRGPGRVNPSTVLRWGTTGVRLPDGRRVRLEMVRCGGRWLTSLPALERFISAQTPNLAAPASAPRTPTQRSRAADRAAAELARRGV